MTLESSASSVNAGDGVFTNHKAYQNDMLNMHFMHPSDNLAIAIIVPPLNGSNYHTL